MDKNKGLVELNGLKYGYQYMEASNGDMCLTTTDPMKYCEGYHEYSEDNLDMTDMQYVIMETNDPDVYPNSTPIIVEDASIEEKIKSVDTMRNLPKSMKPSGTFGTSNDPVLIDKWKPMLEAQGITDPYRQAWMADYCENHVKFDKEEAAKGTKVIEDGVFNLLGIDNKASIEKMQESLMVTEGELMGAPKLGMHITTRIEIKPSLFKRAINWFKEKIRW